jgi:uncharacterized membrane protein
VFDEIFGLPAHPLIVHVPVVFVPLTALLAVGYGLVPPLRRTLGWLLALTAVIAGVSSAVAVKAGEEFQKRLNGGPPGVAQHSDYGETVRNLALLAALVAVGLVVLDLMRRRRKARAATSGGPSGGAALLGIVSVILTVALLGLAGGATWAVVRAGHTGAEMVYSSE